jgi:tryptophanyl-tRNA synthetase
MFARAEAGGLGYGDVKKDLLERILDHFGEMREKREALAAKPDEVEDVLRDGAARARALGAPVLAAARDAAGLGPAR